MRPDSSDASAPSKWMDNARTDLALASIPLPKGVKYELLCFHAQQAAEKSMKAVLLKCEVEFPFTHNLSALLDLLQGCMPIPIELRDVVDLNPYAVVTRYPGEIEPVKKDDYLDAIRLATMTVRWAESIIDTPE